MKPQHKKIFSLSKASASTKSDDLYASAASINEAGTQINNNTKTMASMMLQMNSTKTILIIIAIGVAAYLFLNKDKK